MSFRRGSFIVALVAALTFLLAQAALARTVVTPPWLGPTGWPGSITHVQWEFTQNPTQPLWNTNYTPSGQPQITMPQGAHYPDDVPGPDTQPIPTWHFAEDGWIEIWVPNDPEPRPFKDILIQITSDKAQPTVPVVNVPGLPGADIPGTPGGIFGYPSSEWYTYTYEWHLQPNPQYEIIRIPVIPSTNIEEIVIDTICYVPEPAALGLAGLSGIVLLSRRRWA